MVFRKRRYAIFRLPLRCGDMEYVGWVEATDECRAIDRAREEFGPPKRDPRCLHFALPWAKFKRRMYGC